MKAVRSIHYSIIAILSLESKCSNRIIFHTHYTQPWLNETLMISILSFAMLAKPPSTRDS
jgi:hypothetical protein